VEAELNFQSFLNKYKGGVAKSTSTAFKQWEDLIKKWEDKLKKVDSSLTKFDDFKDIVCEDVYKALRDEKQVFYNALKDRKQELHQVVADSLTTYVSELQDTLKQSTQALVTTQQHLDAAVQELQRLQEGRSSSSNSNNTLAEEHNGSHSNSSGNSNNTLASRKGTYLQ
jgi:hypothetical protein